MNKMIQELELKFSCIETKLELKRKYFNCSYTQETELLNANFDTNNLLKKYSTEFNTYRDGLLNKISFHTRLELDHVNLEKKHSKKLEFKPGLVKSSSISIKKLINTEFEFKNKIFSQSKLIKYKFYLGLNDVIKTILEADDMNVLLEALFLATKLGNLQIVKCLVENGADINQKGGYLNETVLMLASDKGDLNLVKYLVENGADVNEEDKDESTPLLLATDSGDLEKVKYLVENGADVNAVNNINQTALHLASENGYLEIVEYLIKNGADVNARCAHWYDNFTPLICASDSGQFEPVKYLVEHGADVNAKDKNNNTALVLALEKGHLEIVKYFVEIRAENKSNATELLLASRGGDLERVKYLVENGADVNAKGNISN